MSLFINIKELNDLEKSEKFNEIIEMLNEKWILNKDDFDLILRLCSECWYLLSEVDISIKKDSFDLLKCKMILVDVVEYCIKNKYIYNKKCSWFFGYAMTLFPFHFYFGLGNEKFIYYENLGKKICQHLINCHDSNRVVKYLCSLSSKDLYGSSKFYLTKEEVEFEISGDSLIEEYFKEICLNVKY